jgi:hypothetical protein
MDMCERIRTTPWRVCALVFTAGSCQQRFLQETIRWPAPHHSLLANHHRSGAAATRAHLSAHGNGDRVDRFGRLLTVYSAPATPHECALVAPSRDSRFLAALPMRLIGDSADDADPLDAALAELGVD